MSPTTEIRIALRRHATSGSTDLFDSQILGNARSQTISLGENRVRVVLDYDGHAGCDTTRNKTKGSPCNAGIAGRDKHCARSLRS